MAGLKAATSIHYIAGLLSYKASSVSYILYKLPMAAKYTTFNIPKKSGGSRQIDAPVGHLKYLQSQLARLLAQCRLEIEAAGPKRPSLSHGFRKSHSIITNARPHKNRRYVLNLDIENLFPAFNFGRVRGFFLKNNSFQLNEKVATIVAQIACNATSLPQGSPCSPIISDLIAHLLDLRLAQLAKLHKCTYSRYADDLTFSTNQKTFPPALASIGAGDNPEWTLGDPLINEITNCGFSINAAKTRMQCAISRQLVTGLTVNKKVNIRADYYRSARAMCNSIFTNGTYIWARDFAAAVPISNMQRLEGVLNHIHYVKDASDLREAREKREKPTVAEKLYGELLFYKNFIILTRPLILCEGVTDNMYLKAALRKLPAYEPKLIETKGKVKELKISFFKYTSLTDKILRLGGGAGGIKNFITHYEKGMKRYKHVPLKHPVIILIDNDDGAKEIFPS